MEADVTTATSSNSGTENKITDVLQGIIRAHAARHVRGRVADYIPELLTADPNWCALALVSVEGHLYQAGDADRPFTLQSISKPFVYALALTDLGLEEVSARVGAEPSGEPFNAISLEPLTGRPANPMINAGALMTTSLVQAVSISARFERIRECLSAFAGHRLSVDEAVFASEMETGDRNRALAYLMRNAGSLRESVEECIEVYFKQCALSVTTADLAVMAATLANGGVNPRTTVRVVEDRVASHVLSVMTTCGMYDFSGEWLLRVGLPSKSGVSGGIIAVSPAQFGIGVFSPPLDDNGNSERGIEILRELSNRFDLHVMHHVGQPAPSVYLTTTAADRPSHRERHSTERETLAAHGNRIAIVGAQGELEFAAAEALLYSIDDALTPDAHAKEWLVLDLLRVTRLHPVAREMLDAHLTSLLERGIAVAAVVRHGQRVLPSAVEFHELEQAIAWCEEGVLERYRREPRAAGDTSEIAFE
jgi:glutaminase